MKDERQKIKSDLWKNSCVKYLLDMYNHTEDSTVKEVPPTLFEVEQENRTKMETFLYNIGCSIEMKPIDCSDGKSYIVTEIRGPKASGFFFFYFLKFFV